MRLRRLPRLWVYSETETPPGLAAGRGYCRPKADDAVVVSICDLGWL